MSEMMLATLSNIRTVDDMVTAFRDGEHCRRLLESMVWSNGRICPACGYKRSIAIAGRDVGKCRARPGLYQWLQRRLPFPVYGDNTYAPARHETSLEYLAGRYGYCCSRTKACPPFVSPKHSG